MATPVILLALACVGAPIAPIEPCVACLDPELTVPLTPTAAADAELRALRPDLGSVGPGDCLGICPPAITWYDLGDTVPGHWRAYVYVGAGEELWLDLDPARGVVSSLPRPWDPDAADSPVQPLRALHARRDRGRVQPEWLTDPLTPLRTGALASLADGARDAASVQQVVLLARRDLASVNPAARWGATWALTRVADGRGLTELGDALCDDEAMVRWLALAAIGPHRDTAWLTPWLYDPDPRVVSLAAYLRHGGGWIRGFGDTDPETLSAHPAIARMETCAPTHARYHGALWSPALVEAPVSVELLDGGGATLATVKLPGSIGGVAAIDVVLPRFELPSAAILRAGGEEERVALDTGVVAPIVGLCEGVMPAPINTRGERVWGAASWEGAGTCRAAASAAFGDLSSDLATELARGGDAQTFAALVAARPHEADPLRRARLAAGASDVECAGLLGAIGASLTPESVGACAGAGPLTTAALEARVRRSTDPSWLDLLPVAPREEVRADLLRRAVAGDVDALAAAGFLQARQTGPLHLPTPMGAVTGLFVARVGCPDGEPAARIVGKVLLLPRSVAAHVLPLEGDAADALEIALCAGDIRWRRPASQPAPTG